MVHIENVMFFNGLNSYHPNIKLTVEEQRTKFLDTKITRENGEIKMQSIFPNAQIYRPIVI